MNSTQTTGNSIEAYPLQWPVGYKRTSAHLKKHAAFQTSFANARDGAIRELQMMGAKSIIISSNVPLKRDGLPYAVPYGNSKSITDDAGIAVYFDYNEETSVLCCDAFHSLDDNMQAINKTIEALRGIDRWQVSEMLNRAFTGFKALPETTVREEDIWTILGLNERPESTIIIHQAYKQRAKKVHPDAGGSGEEFQRLQDAYKMALKFFAVETIG